MKTPERDAKIKLARRLLDRMRDGEDLTERATDVILAVLEPVRVKDALDPRTHHERNYHIALKRAELARMIPNTQEWQLDAMTALARIKPDKPKPEKAPTASEATASE